jgi:peptide/nickel transport system ATP-binding protein
MEPAPDALAIRHLRVEFALRKGYVTVPVDDVSFTVPRGGVLGLVGESGCGKSMTALATIGLIPHPGRLAAGQILLDGQDLALMPDRELRCVRGDRIGMVFQEPMTSLNPVYSVGEQIAETVRRHRGLDRRASWTRAVEMLARVGIPDAAERARAYPHQLSGGMRQRAMIAMALSCDPDLLIADEPTTALDTTVQAQIVELLLELKQELKMAILLITHDLALAAEVCDMVAVMYAGEVVETADAMAVLSDPHHPYTEGLVKSVPRLTTAKSGRLGVIRGAVPASAVWPSGCRFAPRCDYRFARCSDRPGLMPATANHRAACWLLEAGPRSTLPAAFTTARGEPTSTCRASGTDGGDEPLLRATNLSVHYPIRRALLRRTVGHVKAVDGIDIAVARGETLGLVGESGCGKTTLGRALLRLVEPTSGSVLFEGCDLTRMTARALRATRSRMQMVFQDPVGSLNPRMSVGDIVGEGLLVHGIGDRKARLAVVKDTLERVGLSADHISRYPHEFSGGQRQRIGIARALIVKPKLLVADEPVSALDASVQSQVLNLLISLRDDFGLTYVFIAHNLAAVAYVADRIAVMYLGKIVEHGAASAIYGHAVHPYTQALISAVPEIEVADRRERIVLGGELPSPSAPPSGCRFRTRCPLAQRKGTENGICAEREPELRQMADGRLVACHFAEESLAGIDPEQPVVPAGGTVGRPEPA